MMQKALIWNKIETDPDKQSTEQGVKWGFPAPVSTKMEWGGQATSTYFSFMVNRKSFWEHELFGATVNMLTVGEWN